MRHLQLFFVSLFSVAFAFAQDIPNGDFTYWETQSLFENPNHYPYSSNTVSQYGPLFPIVNVMPDTNASHGNLALRVETKVDISGSFPGWCSNARIEGMDTSYGGFPFTEEPDSFSCHLNYDVSGNDTAYLLVIFKRLGITRTYNLFPIYGQSNGWEQHRFPLWQLPPHPAGNFDSLVIAVYSSNPFNNGPYQDGNYVMLDNLNFDSFTQPPNAGFESWVDGMPTEEPKDWYTLNQRFQAFGMPPYATRDSFLNPNEPDIRLVGASLPIGSFIPGYITLDSGIYYSPQQSYGREIFFKPDSACFKYRYYPLMSFSCPDSAFVAFHFYKNEQLIEEHIEKLPCTMGFPVDVKIDFDLSETPDHYNVTICPFGMYGFVDWQYALVLDKLSFYCGGIGIEIPEETKDFIFPNPSNAVVYLPEWTKFYQLFSSNGQMVREGNDYLDVQDLSHGVYTIICSDRERKQKSFSLVVQ